MKRRRCNLWNPDYLDWKRWWLAPVQLILVSWKRFQASFQRPAPINFSTKLSFAGDYTLLSVPWARGASVTFNDTTASTLSTVGNAALFLGGLYLLSGFPAAASALADPFGISRRLGVASPTRTARPRAGSPAPRFQHRISKGEEAFLKKTKLDKMKPNECYS